MSALTWGIRNEVAVPEEIGGALDVGDGAAVAAIDREVREARADHAVQLLRAGFRTSLFLCGTVRERASHHVPCVLELRQLPPIRERHYYCQLSLSIVHPAAGDRRRRPRHKRAFRHSAGIDASEV